MNHHDKSQAKPLHYMKYDDLKYVAFVACIQLYSLKFMLNQEHCLLSETLSKVKHESFR